jgi:hypothetical protein
VTPRFVRVQRMTRKWGSCSARGTITLAADLTEQDRHFQDFVVAHELLHLRVPNHGRLFKALMTACAELAVISMSSAVKDPAQCPNRPVGKIIDESLAQSPSRPSMNWESEQLKIGFDRRPSPPIASAIRRALRCLAGQFWPSNEMASPEANRAKNPGLAAVRDSMDDLPKPKLLHSNFGDFWLSLERVLDAASKKVADTEHLPIPQP